uniref:Uncharacterized protein At1g28695-like n=1 Tax=Nicotiana tabacum TaxID=4097 RepID=A0A1S4AX86_TOBAC|nr:PREDICTED: uncharacterized protein At1g28695-like [Nicotiana tabacum]
MSRANFAIWQDTGVMRLRNPFLMLSKSKKLDIQMNTGFYYVRSNRKTISLFEICQIDTSKCESNRELAINCDKICHRGILLRDIELVVTVHANCCRSIEAKVADLKNVIMDWKRFKEAIAAAGEDERNNGSFKWSRHISGDNSWHVHFSALSRFGMQMLNNVV